MFAGVRPELRARRTPEDLVRLGLVGYGVGGRYFHAPFAVAAKDVELAGVVSRSPDRRAELAADFPGVPAYGSLTELLAAGVDAVTITTPPQTRRELVLEAIAAGVPTIADKPFAPTAAAGRELVAAARDAGVPLNVFHNRRWDADIRTLAAVLRGGRLGELWGVESRMEQADSATLEVGPDAGLLRDLGSHLVDQVLWLLGPARTVYAELDHLDLDGGRTDCRFTVSITHTSGVRSRVTSSKANHRDDRELRAYGSAGSYMVHSTDVQAQAVFAGKRPTQQGDTWGYDAPEHWAR
jgi:predicted dehydrogenase